MEAVVFEGFGLVVTKLRDRYFLQYNAGTHGVAMRKEGITKEQAMRVMTGQTHEVTSVLIDLQRRLSSFNVESGRAGMY
jgi:hypothetical protein